jgi:DNA-3-methyladenine glycosylase
MLKTRIPQPKGRRASASSGELQTACLLSPEFFARPPRGVARALLGKLLMRREGDELLAGRIVETEAYLGQADPAAHAAAGRTARNSVLFGPPGHAYIYFIYGNHFCLNVSCLPPGEAGCVLLRALEPVMGTGLMAHNRGLGPSRTGTAARLLTSGPGRLCQAFAITRLRDNSKDLTAPASDLTLWDDGFRPRHIVSTPRIGITKAAEAMLRFYITGNRFVSGKRD